MTPKKHQILEYPIDNPTQLHDAERALDKHVEDGWVIVTATFMDQHTPLRDGLSLLVLLEYWQNPFGEEVEETEEPWK